MTASILGTDSTVTTSATSATHAPPMAVRLERCLAAAEPGRRPTVLTCKPIIGGYSRETAIADVQWDDGGTEKLILRADPPAGAGVFQSDRDVERDVLRWLSTCATVSVAPVRYYDQAGAFFGSKCLVMGFVEGRPLQALAAEPGGLEWAADLFIATVARLHSTPLNGLPAVLAVPPDLRTYLDGMAETYLRVEREIGDSSPVLRYAAAVMRAHTPPPVPFSLVHGDCQPGNMLVAPGLPPVVIDWEFARIGDPREDLGYYRQIPLEPNLYTADPQGFLARYRERTGLTADEVNPTVVDYFLLVGIATLLSQMVRAADSIGKGRPGGLAAYLINGISLQYDLFLDICKRIDRAGWGTIVISTPNTEVLILDCCRELLEEVLPHVVDEPAAVRLHMIETVLRATAARSGHEIAWMREEIEAMLGYAAEVAESTRDGEVSQALERARSSRSSSLHLEDVADAYRLASDAFSAAMEAARKAADTALMQRSVELLDARICNERLVCGGWLSTAGR